MGRVPVTTNIAETAVHFWNPKNARLVPVCVRECQLLGHGCPATSVCAGCSRVPLAVAFIALPGTGTVAVTVDGVLVVAAEWSLRGGDGVTDLTVCRRSRRDLLMDRLVGMTVSDCMALRLTTACAWSACIVSVSLATETAAICGSL